MKKIAENDKANFYINDICEIVEKNSEDFKLIIAERKDNGFKEYILLYKNEPTYCSQKIEDIWYRMSIYKKIYK